MHMLAAGSSFRCLPTIGLPLRASAAFPNFQRTPATFCTLSLFATSLPCGRKPKRLHSHTSPVPHTTLVPFKPLGLQLSSTMATENENGNGVAETPVDAVATTAAAEETPVTDSKGKGKGVATAEKAHEDVAMDEDDEDEDEDEDEVCLHFVL